MALALHPSFVVVVRLVTDAGSPLSIDLLTAMVTVFLLMRRRMRLVSYVIAVRVLELGAETVLKQAIDRPRPSVPMLFVTAHGTSFPSGHTAGTAALFTSLFLLARPLLAARGRALALTAAGLAVALVACSRVLLGVHFPSDVLGGAILGALCAVVLGPFAILRPDGEQPNVRGASERQS
jgi:undecaprenyl-diphosphatase